jgi:hypothetical protein
MAGKMPTQAPTIATMKAKGLTGVCPVCRVCHHSASVAFDVIGLPDGTPFPEIGRARRFRFSTCGARDFAVVPDWRGAIARWGWAVCGDSSPVATSLRIATACFAWLDGSKTDWI